MKADSKDQKDSKSAPDRIALFKWGMAATLVYLFLLGLITFGLDKSIIELTPNEFGDFLAGAFSPVAFLWLVLGFIQQGQELRIQATELNNSVEQNRQLVSVTRKQLEHDIKLAKAEIRARSAANMPSLALSRDGGSVTGGVRKYQFKLVNSGRACTSLKVLLGEQAGKIGTVGETAILKNESEFEFEIWYDEFQEVDFDLVVQFTDVSGLVHYSYFDVERVENGRGVDLKVWGQPRETVLV